MFWTTLSNIMENFGFMLFFEFPLKCSSTDYDYLRNSLINRHMKTTTQKDIIIFDGECNLCNGVVGWLLKFAPASIFSFIPFQSPQGQQYLKTYGFNTERLETVILIDEKGVHTHSDGFLRIVSNIPKWQRVAALLAFIPRMIRDGVYKWASKNRVKLFGQSQSCTISLR